MKEASNKGRKASASMQAMETLDLEEVKRRYPKAKANAANLLPRLAQLGSFSSGSRILDVGAAQGRFVAACKEMGFEAAGVEPWGPAIEMSREFGRSLDMILDIRHGTAEMLPFDERTFDIVHAMSVIEHVDDAQRAFDEAYRVLKPGGVFWFLTASSVCPKQQEIQGVPLFGWYPDRLKRRIMKWACESRPHLVGHTQRPAIHWFTPWKARRMLRKSGFRTVFDRWSLPLAPGSSVGKRRSFAIIRSTPVTKLLADVLRPCCSYAAVKPL